MTPPHDLSRLMRKLRNRAIKRYACYVAADASIMAILLCSAVVLLDKFGAIPWGGFGIYPLTVLLSFFLSLFLEIRRRRGFVDALMEIDLRFGLREMLSSAFECLKRAKKSMIAELLLLDAARFMGRVKPKELLPIRPLRRHALIPLSALFLVLAAAVDLPPAQTPLVAEMGIAADRLVQRMEEHAKKEGIRSGERRAAKSDLNRLTRKLERLERRLRNRRISPKKALQSMRDLLQEAKETQARLSEQLTEELSLDRIEGIPSLTPELTRGIPTEALERIEALLEKSFEGDVPDSVAETLLALKTLNETQGFLDSAIDGLESADKRGAGSESGGAVGRNQARDNKTPGASEGRRGAAPGESDQADGERESEGPLASMAGRGADERPLGEPKKMKGSKSQPTRDPGQAGPGKRYEVLVRSLPIMDQARLEPEEIVRPYRREIEHVLANDQIPVNYREFIRNYFLSIGLQQEAKENE